MSERSNLIAELESRKNELKSLMGMLPTNNYNNSFEIANRVVQQIAMVLIFLFIGFGFGYIFMKRTKKSKRTKCE